MRAFLRLVALLCLVVAVIAAVIDAIQSVAAAQLVLTPLSAAWLDVAPETLAAAQALIETYLLPVLWDPVMVWVLAQPAFAVFLALALLLYVIAFRRKPAAGRFSAR